MKRKRLKIGLTILGIVILGAVGSGVWEIAGNPLLRFFSNVAVYIVTFGKEILLDSIYEDIGRGYSEVYSIGVFFFLAIIIACLSLIGFIFIRLIFKDLVARFEGEPERERLTKQKVKRMKRRFQYMWYIGALFTLLFIILTTTKFLVALYKNGARSHIYQSVTICSPYISEKEEKELLSKFALIKSRNDYINLNNQLKNIAEQNGVELPELEPF